MNGKIRLTSLALVALVLGGASGHAMETNRLQVIRDVEYARVGEHSLKMDLHLLSKERRSPILVWVHGGAWRSGSKNSMPLGMLV